MPVAIPNLSSTSLITTPDAMIGYVLRHYIQSPKSMSDTFFEQAVSLQDTISRFGDVRSSLPDRIKAELQVVLTRLFPASLIAISVTTEDVTGDRYDVVIDAQVSIGGQVYRIDNRAAIVAGRIQLSID